MIYGNWQKEYNNYFSYHILTKYLGDYIPRYTVLENPDGDGWVIGIFFSFIGEYAPLEEDEEPRIVFDELEEAKLHVDTVLKWTTEPVEIAGCFQHKCGHQIIVKSQLVNNDEQFTLNMLKDRASKSNCFNC